MLTLSGNFWKFSAALHFLLSGSSLAASPPTTPPVALEERVVEVAGDRLHFNIIPGRGTPILFEAGGGDDATAWGDIPSTIATITGAPVITYDRVGFGKSEVGKTGGDEDRGVLRGISDLEKGLETLGFQRQIVLVAHSYGGFYSTLYAARHPDRVRYAVMIDANYACWFPPEFTRKLLAGKEDDLRKLKAAGKLGPYYQTVNLAQTVEALRRAPFPNTVPAIDLVSERPPFSDPDDITRWNACHREFAEGAPNRQAITAYGSGHYIYRDNPALVVNAITTAYASTVAPAARLGILERGMGHAVEGANEAGRREAAARHSEGDLNAWGYRLMAQGNLPVALDVFKLNVALHPDSWNVYDSYGEALLKAGRPEDAADMYRKSVALNPNSAKGRAALKSIGDNRK